MVLLMIICNTVSKLHKKRFGCKLLAYGNESGHKKLHNLTKSSLRQLGISEYREWGLDAVPCIWLAGRHLIKEHGKFSDSGLPFAKLHIWTRWLEGSNKDYYFSLKIILFFKKCWIYLKGGITEEEGDTETERTAVSLLSKWPQRLGLGQFKSKRSQL